MSSIVNGVRNLSLQSAAKSAAELTFGDLVLRAEIVEITPELAEKWLSRSTTRNRPLKIRTVKKYATLMREGRWVLNGEPIIRDENGNINNGHHRLHGSILAQASFLSIVINGVPSAAFTSYDRGKIRSTADILALDGSLNTNALSSMISHFWRHQLGMHLQTSAYPEPDVAVTIKRNHPGMAESATLSHLFTEITRPSVAGFCHYVFTRQDPDCAQQFFEGLHTGANLKETNPILHLRKRLLADRASRAKLPAHHIIALFFKAWVAYRDNIPTRSLRWRTEGSCPENFPSID